MPPAIAAADCRPAPGDRMLGSALEIHGTADRVVPYAGRPSDGAGAVLGFLAGWVRRDGS